MLDENVPEAVARALVAREHEVVRSTEAVPAGSPDHLVATAAQEDGWILVSHDKDFKSIERLASDGQRERYPTLSRLMLSCPEPESAARIERYLRVIEAEYERATAADERVVIEVGARRLRIFG